MQPPPTTVNPVATVVNTIIKGGSDAVVTVAEGMAIASQPWLGWPWVEIFWQPIFQWIAGIFRKALEQLSTDVIIDTQTELEKLGVSKALAGVAAAEKGGNPDEIKKAIQAYADAQSALIHFDGSAQPK